MKFYNSRTRQVEDFHVPQDNTVKMYSCGPTVYDRLHVGNWSSYIYWDTLVRTLLDGGFTLKRVMNITDVGHLTSDADEGEDKLQKSARREGATAWEVAQRYTGDFIKGMKELNLLAPQHLVKATEHIAEQIGLIKNLEKKGYTYVITDGVYYDTSKFSGYADFAQLNLEAQKAGARVHINPEKRNPADFALWKFSPKDQKRDMEWDSPWGRGFPGWHIECSAMAIKYLGESLDIHTGGIDHIPVHHTNEIAQSEAATGKRFSNFWLHNNFLLSDGKKISKSKENGYTLGDLEDRGYGASVFRLFVLQSHYRNESNFSWENMRSAKRRLNGFQAMADLRWQPVPGGELTSQDIEKAESVISSALAEDLDTPAALMQLSAFEELSRSKLLPPSERSRFSNFLQRIDKLLGLELLSSADINNGQKQMLAARESARQQKNWQEADRLRESLGSEGIELNDTPKGQIWFKKTAEH